MQCEHVRDACATQRLVNVAAAHDDEPQARSQRTVGLEEQVDAVLVYTGRCSEVDDDGAAASNGLREAVPERLAGSADQRASYRDGQNSGDGIHGELDAVVLIDVVAHVAHTRFVPASRRRKRGRCPLEFEACRGRRLIPAA
jgi:hypothetical protein